MELIETLELIDSPTSSRPSDYYGHSTKYFHQKSVPFSPFSASSRTTRRKMHGHTTVVTSESDSKFSNYLQSNNMNTLEHTSDNDQSTTVIQAIPAILKKKKKKILIGSETYHTFVRRSIFDAAHSTSSNTLKTNPNVLKRGYGGNKLDKPEASSGFKHRGPGGKMFVNELWSSKYYHNVVHSSLLADQQDELMKLGYQTTKEKIQNTNEIYYCKEKKESNTFNLLVNKYQNNILITEDDLLLESSFDYSLATHRFEEDSQTLEADSEMRETERSSSIKRNFRSSKLRILTTVAGNKSQKKDFFLPSLGKDQIQTLIKPYIETTPLTLGQKLTKTGSFALSKSSSEGFFKAIRPQVQSIAKDDNVSHSIKLSRRRKVRVDRSLNDGSPNNTSSKDNISGSFDRLQLSTSITTKMSTFGKQSEALKSPKPYIIKKKERLVRDTEKEMKGTRAIKQTLNKLFQNCNDFSEDKEYKKYTIAILS